MMKMKLSGVAVIIFGLILANAAWADFSAEKWQHFKDITVIGSGAPQGKLVKVTLDQDVFNNANSDLSDLRVLGIDRAEVPYKLVVERDTFNAENIYPVRILNNSFTGDYNLFIVDLGRYGFLNSNLDIANSSENFKRQVEISGSDDMVEWNTLKTDGYIYDYTDRRASFKAQDASISYPENAYRYIRVKVFSGGETPLAISGARVSKITSSVSRETSLDPKYEIKENPAKRSTEVIMDLEKEGWPTSSVTLNAEGENFNRETTVYESDDKNIWRILGQGYVFKINTPKFQGSNLSINYPESGSRYLKVEIYNGDNEPIAITGVSVKAILRNIVFQYSGSLSYKLYYGNNKARFPQYDLERFFPYLDTGYYLVGALRQEQINPEFKKEIPPLPPVSERYPYLLKSVLVLTILILGFFIFKFMKKVNPVGK